MSNARQPPVADPASPAYPASPSLPIPAGAGILLTSPEIHKPEQQTGASMRTKQAIVTTTAAILVLARASGADVRRDAKAVEVASAVQKAIAPEGAVANA